MRAGGRGPVLSAPYIFSSTRAKIFFNENFPQSENNFGRWYFRTQTNFQTFEGPTSVSSGTFKFEGGMGGWGSRAFLQTEFELIFFRMTEKILVEIFSNTYAANALMEYRVNGKKKIEARNFFIVNRCAAGSTKFIFKK